MTASLFTAPLDTVTAAEVEAFLLLASCHHATLATQVRVTCYVLSPMHSWKC